MLTEYRMVTRNTWSVIRGTRNIAEVVRSRGGKCRMVPVAGHKYTHSELSSINAFMDWKRAT